MRHMVVIVPELTGYASIRHVAVSLPYVAGLVDGVKYMELADIKPPEGDTELRRQRAPSLRFLVKQALGAAAPSNSARNCAGATGGNSNDRQ